MNKLSKSDILIISKLISSHLVLDKSRLPCLYDASKVSPYYPVSLAAFRCLIAY